MVNYKAVIAVLCIVIALLIGVVVRYVCCRRKPVEPPTMQPPELYLSEPEDPAPPPY